MVKFPLECKVEALTTRERPALQHTYLRIKEKVTGRGKTKTTTRQGFLEATDSYRLVRIPVELADSDTEGHVPGRALAEARKAKTGEISVNGTVTAEVDGGQLILDKPTIIGPFPDLDKILDKRGPIAFSVGLNPRLLHGVAEAIGAGKRDHLVMEFEAKDDGTPDPLRPIHVRLSSDKAGERVAIVMPVRLA